jgi:hypothetical protein
LVFLAQAIFGTIGQVTSQSASSQMRFEEFQSSLFGQSRRLSFPGTSVIAIETVMRRIGEYLRSGLHNFECAH